MIILEIIFYIIILTIFVSFVRDIVYPENKDKREKDKYEDKDYNDSNDLDGPNETDIV